MSNSNPQEMIAVDPTMLPLVVQSLIIQRNVELMCGRKDAVKLLTDLIKDVEVRMSPAARFFEAGSWAEIGHVLKTTGLPFSLSLKRPEWRSWGYDGWIVVSIGEKHWKTSESEYKAEGPELKQIHDALEGIAPLINLQPA